MKISFFHAPVTRGACGSAGIEVKIGAVRMRAGIVIPRGPEFERLGSVVYCGMPVAAEEGWGRQLRCDVFAVAVLRMVPVSQVEVRLKLEFSEFVAAVKASMVASRNLARALNQWQGGRR